MPKFFTQEECPYIHPVHSFFPLDGFVREEEGSVAKGSGGAAIGGPA